jgi:hypothetical protein
VSRGDLRPQYDRCVRFLRKLGTPIAGVVFNRAGEVDVERSAALSAVSRSRANQSVRRDADAGTRFGPLGAGMTRAAGEADAEADRKGSGIL